MKKKFESVVNKNPLSAMALATAEACTMASKQTGAVYAAALRTVTPPHGTGAKMATTKNKKSVGIDKLKQRIAADISPGASGFDVVPVRRADGRWIAFKDGHYSDGDGNFGFVVPRADSFKGADGKKYPVPFVKPEEVYKRRVFYKRRGAMRAGYVVPGSVNFARKGAVDRLVKRQQKMAGFTISGWAAGARFFGTGKKLAAGFFDKLGGYGTAGGSEDFYTSGSGADMYDSGRFEYIGYMENYEVTTQKWHSRMMKTARVMAGKALANMERNIIRWYKKKAKEIVG